MTTYFFKMKIYTVLLLEIVSFKMEQYNVFEVFFQFAHFDY